MAAVAGIVLALAACGPARPPTDPAGVAANIALRPKEVQGGGTQALDLFGALNPDCSVEGYPSLHILQPPSNGRLTIERGEAHTSFPGDDIRAKCNTLSTPTVVLSYTPKPGYTGSDAATVEVLFPMGSVRTLEYRITVR
jgi:hypothetical protein